MKYHIEMKNPTKVDEETWKKLDEIYAAPIYNILRKQIKDTQKYSFKYRIYSEEKPLHLFQVQAIETMCYFFGNVSDILVKEKGVITIYLTHENGVKGIIKLSKANFEKDSTRLLKIYKRNGIFEFNFLYSFCIRRDSN